MSGQAIFDPGLQPERTELAWRRTVLSVLVGGLLSLRLLPSALGAWSFAACVLGLALTVVLWVLARRRSTLVRESLRDARELPGGAVLLFLSALISGGAVLGLAYVATR
jgi:uncharacterized membrane protein YidH (DUF202 family)